MKFSCSCISCIKYTIDNKVLSNIVQISNNYELSFNGYEIKNKKYYFRMRGNYFELEAYGKDEASRIGSRKDENY